VAVVGSRFQGKSSGFFSDGVAEWFEIC
jgi:hypothetical protein